MTGVNSGMVAARSLAIAWSVVLIDPDFRMASVPAATASVRERFDHPSNRDRDKQLSKSWFERQAVTALQARPNRQLGLCVDVQMSHRS